MHEIVFHLLIFLPAVMNQKIKTISPSKNAFQNMGVL